MATRLWQTGFELNTLYEVPDSVPRTSDMVISSTKSNTGTYSLRSNSGSCSSRGVSFSSTTQISVHFYLNHNGYGGGVSSPIIVEWSTSDGLDNYVSWNVSGGTINMVINGSVEDSISLASSGFSGTDTWHDLGFTLFTDPTTGWASFYVNGTQILSVTGLNTGTYVDAVYFGGSDTFAYWNNYMYVDDIYIDDTVGDPDSVPTPARFLWAIAAGNGSHDDWAGSDGDSVDNYLLVDDATPDDDTTKVSATSAALQDTYSVDSIAVPVGWSIAAAIPTAVCKRAATTEEIKMLAYDGGTLETGSAQAPSVSYAITFDRMTVQPDTTAWNETDFNAMHFGVESDGTY